MNFTGHLGFGLEVLKILEDKNILKRKINKRKFLTGIVAPDIAIADGYSKNEIHFRDGVDMIYSPPRLEDFLKKYKNRLKEDFVLGYFCHIYSDNVFINKILYSVAVPLDKNKKFTKKKDDVKFIYIKKQEYIEKFDNPSSSIYDDYTRLNKYLIKEFNIPDYIEYSLEDPKIDEIDYTMFNKFNDVVNEFKDIEVEGDFRYIDKDDFIKVIKEEAGSCVSYIQKNI